MVKSIRPTGEKGTLGIERTLCDPTLDEEGTSDPLEESLTRPVFHPPWTGETPKGRGCCTLRSRRVSTVARTNGAGGAFGETREEDDHLRRRGEGCT